MVRVIVGMVIFVFYSYQAYMQIKPPESREDIYVNIGIVVVFFLVLTVILQCGYKKIVKEGGELPRKRGKCKGVREIFSVDFNFLWAENQLYDNG